MRQIKIYIVFLFCTTCSQLLKGQPLNDTVFQYKTLQSFKLINAGDNKSTTLKNILPSSSLYLFIFLSPECPLCKNYTPVLNQLEKQYDHAVKFIGIVPGKTYTAATIQKFAKKYKTEFAILIDPAKKLTNYLHASVTPEVILLDSQYQLLYQGAIDNRMKSLGVKRWQATENYLSDAVSQYLQHTSVTIKRVKATGCLINDF